MSSIFIHSVYFWLKEGIANEERANFEKGVNTLLGTPGVIFGKVGKVAPTRRPVIDSSYDYNLLLVFSSPQAQDAYQETDEIHKAFIANCNKFWTKVQIYDSISD